MKALPQLLSCLLIASVALLTSGAAWSDTQPDQAQAKSSVKAKPKKAKKPHRKTKRAAKAAVSAVPPAVAVNPYLPGSTAPMVVKPNPYLPAAAVTVASAPNPYLAPVVPVAPAAPLTLAKSLSIASVAASVPAPEKAAPAATPEPVTPWSTGANGAPLAAVTAFAVTPAPAAVAPAPVVVASVTPLAAAPAAIAPSTAVVAPTPPQKAARTAQPAGNPYLAYNPYLVSSVSFNQASGTASPPPDLGRIFSDLRSYLPDLHLPSPDIDILPSIKKVYPTGEKPLVVLTFKCPTELIGITPPPTKALRWLISAGMDVLNSTNLLSFNMQQVCQ